MRQEQIDWKGPNPGDGEGSCLGGSLGANATCHPAGTGKSASPFPLPPRSSWCLSVLAPHFQTWPLLPLPAITLVLPSDRGRHLPTSKSPTLPLPTPDLGLGMSGTHGCCWTLGNMKALFPGSLASKSLRIRLPKSSVKSSGALLPLRRVRTLPMQQGATAQGLAE